MVTSFSNAGPFSLNIILGNSFFRLTLPCSQANLGFSENAFQPISCFFLLQIMAIAHLILLKEVEHILSADSCLMICPWKLTFWNPKFMVFVDVFPFARGLFQVQKPLVFGGGKFKPAAPNTNQEQTPSCKCSDNNPATLPQAGWHCSSVTHEPRQAIKQYIKSQITWRINIH